VAQQAKCRWALYLARQGFGIFPIPARSRVPSKGVSWSDESLTSDPEVIEQWFDLDPEINYGVCPGENFAIIDLDLKGGQNGVEAFELLELQHGEIPTLRVRSASGGLHVYVAVPHPVGNGHRFPEGIDLRGARGYVVGPGCYVQDSKSTGSYEVVDDSPIAPAPRWAVDNMRLASKAEQDNHKALFELDRPENVRYAKSWLANRAPAIEGHRGDEHTFATAVQVKDFGISEDKCFELMLPWNDKCEPPWDLAELKSKVYNAYRYGQTRPGSKGGLMDTFMDLDSELMQDSDYSPPAGEFEGLKSIFFRGNSILNREIRRESAIPQWILMHGMTAVVAKRAMGKSVFMIDIALRLAHDMDWHGVPTAEGMYVVYLCGEDDAGLQEQIRAWCIEHDRDVPDRFMFLAGVVDLMSASEVEKWTRFLLQEIPEGAKVAVFVDTWQRATSRGSQNDDEEMQMAVHHIEAMAKSLNGPSIVAFHPPKHNEQAMMGSSIIENATVGILRISDHLNCKKIEVDRIKGKGVGNYKLARFREIGLSDEDQFGNENTGVVVVPVGGSSEQSDSEQIADDAREVFARVFRELESRRKEEFGEHARPYTISSLAERISKLPNTALDSDPDKAEWAGRLIWELEDAGYANRAERTLRSCLTKSFIDDTRPYVYADGWRISVGPKRPHQISLQKSV